MARLRLQCRGKRFPCTPTSIISHGYTTSDSNTRDLANRTPSLKVLPFDKYYTMGYSSHPTLPQIYPSQAAPRPPAAPGPDYYIPGAKYRSLFQCAQRDTTEIHRLMNDILLFHLPDNCRCKAKQPHNKLALMCKSNALPGILPFLFLSPLRLQCPVFKEHY